MAGRFAHLMIAGAAVVGGMFIQGDIDLDGDSTEHGRAQAILDSDADEIDRTVDRIVDREVGKITISAEDRRTEETDPATRRALTEAVAELVRAEGSLISAKLDDNMPAAAIKQVEQRRDLAKQAVEKLADDAKAETRGNRDALRQNIREEVREKVREAVRS